MRRLFLLGSLSFAAVMGLAGTRSAAGEPRCTRASSTPATIEAVQKSYADWHARCVRIRGIRLNDRLLAGRRALLERSLFDPPRQSLAIRNDASRGHDARWVEIVGTLGNCALAHETVAAMQAENANDLIWVSGYCHTSNEAYIDVTSERIVSRRPVVRLIESEVPQQQRHLVEAPPGLSGRDRYDQAAGALLDALRRGDEAAFLKINYPPYPTELAEAAGKPLPRGVADDVKRSRRAFRRLSARGSIFLAVDPTRAQRRIFVDSEDLAQTGSSRSEPADYITCWCRAGDCTGRWPVLEIDADNQGRRPYACLRTGGFVLGPRRGTVPYVDVPEKGTGLAEPRWPRP